MREASCRALEVIERGAAAEGVDYRQLISGLPVPLDHLLDRSEWIDWDVLAEICDRFERAAGPGAMLRAGRAGMRTQLTKPLLQVAGLVVDIRHLYTVGMRWLVPLTFQNLVIRLDPVGRDELRVEVQIPREFRGSSAFLRIWPGLYEELPSLFALPRARVEAEITPHLGRYRVVLPARHRRRWPRLRLGSTGRAVAELERQIDELKVLERERTRVDQALRERERMLSNLIANLSGAVYRCRMEDLRFEFASARCLELTGYAADELVGGEVALTALIHPDDADAFREKLRASLDAKTPSSTEYRLRTRAGELRWVLDVAQGLYDADGRVTGIEGFMTDVTAQKRLEQELNDARRVEGMGRLAGGIAHDFNNLLTIMLSSLALADVTLTGDSPAREYTAHARDAAKRAATLTRQLLAFARKQIIEPRIVNLNGLVHGMEKLLRRALGDDIELRCHVAEDLWSVEIDPGQFEQVLLNLAVNGRDAMTTGGTLTVETTNLVLEEPSAELPGVPPGAYVMLSVRDTGVGMTEAVRARAFEPFFTTKAHGKGTGLGLASSHGIVRQAHGHFLLCSALGEGTEARIYLPRALGVPEVQGTSERPPAATGEGETLLVVDDHPVLLSIVVRALEAEGYSVLATSSPLEALELAARSEAIDLLITDVIMPELSGVALAEKLTDSRPDLPVIFISGYTEQRLTRELGAGSHADFLPKPFTPRVLAAKVREVLDRSVRKRVENGKAQLRVVR